MRGSLNGSAVGDAAPLVSRPLTGDSNTRRVDALNGDTNRSCCSRIGQPDARDREALIAVMLMRRNDGSGLEALRRTRPFVAAVAAVGLLTPLP